jgi:hypothetical protein
MTIQQYEPPAPLPATTLDEQALGWVARLRAAAEIAGYIGGTEFVPEALRNRPEAITAAILYGEEVGLAPMRALAMVAVIKGRPAMLAEAQRSLILAAGHELWFEESTTTRAIAAGRRRGDDRVGRITWTMDDAKRAGLAGQPNFQRYPAEMLRARSSAALARTMFADVIGGMAAIEELVGEPDNGPPPGLVDAPPPADAPPAPMRQPRRRPAASSRPAGPAPAETPPKPDPEPTAATPLDPPTPPDTQPQPPAPDEPLATEAYKRRIFATMRELGIGAQGDDAARRAERLGYVETIVERELASSNELTLGEAGRVIDQLKADKAARAAGERALIDELRAQLDATEVGAAGSAKEPEPEEGDRGAADEPETAPGPDGEREPGRPEPVPYNEFPDGF